MNGAVRASELNTWAHLSARPHPEGKVTNLRPENAESLWATATLMERTGQRSTGRHGNQLKLWSYITNEVIWHKDVTVIVNKVFLLQVTVTGDCYRCVQGRTHLVGGPGAAGPPWDFSGLVLVLVLVLTSFYWTIFLHLKKEPDWQQSVPDYTHIWSHLRDLTQNILNKFIMFCYDVVLVIFCVVF